MTQGDFIFFAAAALVAVLGACILWRWPRPPVSLLFLLSLRLAAQDLYVNFEGVAAGTGFTSVNMGVISKTNGNAVTFSTTGSGSSVQVVEDSTAHPGLLRPVQVAGTWYTNSAPTRALLCDSAGGTGVRKFQWTYAASRKVSCGFSITLTNWGSAAGNFYNPGGYESGGTYGVISMVDNPTPYFQSETIAGTGANINVGNFTIWITTLWDSANSKYVCAFYNQTNMVLLGYSTESITANSTVNTMGFGVTGDHSFSANRNYYLNNLILYTNGTVWPVWPGNNLQVPTNSTDTAVTAAIAAASAGDHVALPITNLSWSSGVTVNKDSLVLYGLGGTNGTKLDVGNTATAFTLSANYCTVSNLWVKGTKPASSGNYQNTGFDIVGQSNRVCYNLISQLQIGVYSRQWGLSDNNVWIDNTKFRHIWSGGTMNETTIFSTFYPLAFDSNIYWWYEHDQFWVTSDCFTNGALGYFSSQQSDAWGLRHCSIIWSNSNNHFSPMFDFHGDDVGGGLPRPGMALQNYKNTITLLAYQSGQGGKWFDIRGTKSAIYSNTMVQIVNSGESHAIHYREERPSDSPNYLVNNSYVWENYRGSSGSTAADVTDDANITEGVDYFASAMSPLLRTTYPHPLRNLPAEGGGDLAFTRGTPQLRGLRLKR